MEMFRSFSVTKTGSKHEDGVCQDASDHKDYEDAAIAIVADGHGSSRCFRSDIGSQKAVKITANCIEAFMKDSKNVLKNPIEAKNNNGNDGKAELRGLGRQIINKWFNAVMHHEEINPLAKDPKMEQIPDKYKERYRDNPDYRCHAYGTTLMAVTVTKDYWFGVQIGDGKCIVLYEDGNWAFPIPPDDRCSHNTTTSICDDEPVSALEELRCWFGFKDDVGKYMEYSFGVDGQNKDSVKEVKFPPLAIFIGSDGVEDSYPYVDNDRYVINFYRNRVISIYKKSFESAKEEIEDWAKRFADRESTDDVSIAGVIGDFTGRAALIEEFTKEAEAHEIKEAASVKRRDADEKKMAYETLKKKTQPVHDSIKNLKSKISTAQQEYDTLQAKIQELNTNLSNNKKNTEDERQAVVDLQNEVKSIKATLAEAKEAKRKQSALMTIAEHNEKDAEKTRTDAEDEYKRCKDNLDKEKKSLEEESQKNNIVITPPGKQGNNTQAVIITGVTVTYDLLATKEKLNKNGIALSEKIMNQLEKISQLEAEEKKLQAELSTKKQNAEQKRKETNTERQKLGEAEQHIHEAEGFLSEANKKCTALETKIKQDISVQQDESAISDLERSQKAKLAEIETLNNELKILTEQEKTQIDKCNAVKSAWDEAEKAATELEKSM